MLLRRFYYFHTHTHTHTHITLLVQLQLQQSMELSPTGSARSHDLGYRELKRMQLKRFYFAKSLCYVSN